MKLREDRFEVVANRLTGKPAGRVGLSKSLLLLNGRSLSWSKIRKDDLKHALEVYHKRLMALESRVAEDADDVLVGHMCAILR